MRLGLVVAALLAVPLAFAAPAERAADVPWWEASLQDLDRDAIDDALPRVGIEPLRVLVAFRDVPTARDLTALRGASFEPLDWYAHFDVVLVETVPARLAALRDVPGVVLVERDDVIRPLLRESVPLLGVPQVWETYDATGEGIVVAVLDDGTFEQHPDLMGRVAGRFDAGAPALPGPFGLAVESVPIIPAGADGHGTHVVGTILGPGTQSSGTYRGVAPDARFANVKVFSGPNSTSSSLVLEGLDWTLSNADRLGIRIASMSLGGAPSDGRDALSRAVDRAVERGLVVIAAAGNAGPGDTTIGSPGAADRAITVGAVDKRKQLAPYSSRGPTTDGRLKPEVVAPGTSITSTVPPASTTTAAGLLGNDRDVYYGQLSGTSMAAPHVSGIVALMLQVNPDLTPYEVKQILVATAQDLGDAGRDNRTGYGFVNAIAATQVAADPTLLQSPQLAAIVGTLPPPQETPWYEDMQHKIDELRRSGALTVYGAMAATALAVIILGVAIVRRWR